jgi:hypothetical protein
VWDMQTICRCYLSEQLSILGWLFVTTLYYNLSLPYRVNVFQHIVAQEYALIPSRCFPCHTSRLSSCPRKCVVQHENDLLRFCLQLLTPVFDPVTEVCSHHPRLVGVLIPDTQAAFQGIERSHFDVPITNSSHLSVPVALQHTSKAVSTYR